MNQIYTFMLWAKAENIKFAKAGSKEHFSVEHGGNTKNPTFGKFINRKIGK